MHRPLKRLALLGATCLLGLSLTGCYLPFVRTEPGTYRSSEGPPEPGARTGVGKQIALYIPNRLVDLLDIVRVSLSPGLSLGFDNIGGKQHEAGGTPTRTKGHHHETGKEQHE